GWELTRRTPRLPAIAASALASIAMRWALAAARLCANHVHPAVWAAIGLAALAAVAILARAPTRGPMALRILDKPAASGPESLAAKALPSPPSRLFFASLVAAAGVPCLLFVMQRVAVGIVIEGVVFVAYAIAAPLVVRRFDPAPPTNAPLSRRTLFAIAAGF